MFAVCISLSRAQKENGLQVAAISPGLVPALSVHGKLAGSRALLRYVDDVFLSQASVCGGAMTESAPLPSFHDPAITPSLLPKLFSVSFLFFAPMFSLAVVVYLLGCSVPSPAHCGDVIAGGPGRIFSLFFCVREVPEKGG